MIYYEDKKFNVINNYKPVIFTNEEILLLFQTMDKYKEQYNGKKYYPLYYCYCILFRLLYSCGLRISEAIKININDINFEENTINIIDSKRHISRLVVFSNSMKKCLEDYMKSFNINEGLVFRNVRNKIINRNKLRTFYK